MISRNKFIEKELFNLNNRYFCTLFDGLSRWFLNPSKSCVKCHEAPKRVMRHSKEQTKQLK